jgi:hypothetical protein
MRELCDAFKAQYRSRLEDQKHGVVGRTPRAAATPIVSTPLGISRTPAGGYGGRTPGMGGMTPGGCECSLCKHTNEIVSLFVSLVHDSERVI